MSTPNAPRTPQAPVPGAVYTCPTAEQYDGDTLLGCGHTFEATPDEEGLVDCPACGNWFDAAEGVTA